ncbi:MAG: hypothetical protein K2K26_01690 [Muribaculaceae bacterium]|nr:hypothetical protein [Muribaculaceae bacterium]
MENNTGYRVNEDGSVTKVIERSNNNGNNNGNKPSNNPSNNSGCIWGIIIAIVIIIVVLIIKFNTSSSHYVSNENTVVAAEEAVAEVVEDNVVSINTFPKPSFSDQCTRRSMDNVYNGYMLVPNFLSYSKVDKDGWIVYYADNGSYLTSVIVDYDGSAYQFVSQLSNGMNSTYSAHKEDWAVDSGLYGSQIYYMKAVKTGGKIYCAIFFVPRGDKSNAKLYTHLTEKIFSSNNFPLW